MFSSGDSPMPFGDVTPLRQRMIFGFIGTCVVHGAEPTILAIEVTERQTEATRAIVTRSFGLLSGLPSQES